MVTLTITAKGQVTLKREVLAHLGLEAGSKVEVDLLPGGRVGIAATHPNERTSWGDFWASLPEYTGPLVSPESEEDAIASYLGDDDRRIAREANERRQG